MLSPSLPWVLRGGVSQVQQYYETLRLPRTQTGRLMDSSLGSSPSPRLRSVRYESTSCRLAPGFTVRRRETGSVGREYRDLTGSWDAPPVPMPCSLTPAGPPHPTNSVFRCCPRSQYDEGSRDEQFRGSITRRQHRLSTLHGGHRCPSCQTRLRRVVSLYREGVEPSGHQQGFRSRTIHELPPFQAYPVAHWLCFSGPIGTPVLPKSLCAKGLRLTAPAANWVCFARFGPVGSWATLPARGELALFDAPAKSWLQAAWLRPRP